jgi:molybdopterin converting factor small subunit
MKITIKLIGPLIYAVGFSEKEFDVPEPATIDGLSGLVGIGQDRPRIVTRNGKAVGRLDELRDGDRVVIAPVYSGG